MIRQLGPDDFSSLYDMLRDYFDESFLTGNSKFSPQNATKFLLSRLTHDYVHGAFIDNILVGCVMTEIEHEFREAPEGYIPIFYVKPECRGTRIARNLVNSAMEICHDNKCATVSTAGMSIFHGNNNKLYDNLFGKFGFEKVSNLLMWRE